MVILKKQMAWEKGRMLVQEKEIKVTEFSHLQVVEYIHWNISHLPFYEHLLRALYEVSGIQLLIQNIAILTVETQKNRLDLSREDLFQQSQSHQNYLLIFVI